jgi:ketosteroid isomerase-like protein
VSRRPERRPVVDALILRAERLTVLYSRLVLAAPDCRLKRRIVLQFLKRSAAALNRLDLDVYLIGFRDDVEWRGAGDLPGSRTFVGIDAVRAYLEDYFAEWSEFDNRPFEVLAATPQRVGFMSELQARGARSGAPVTQFEAYVVELERGWVVRLHEFRWRESALLALEADNPATVIERGGHPAG